MTTTTNSLHLLFTRARRSGIPLLILPVAFLTGCHWGFAWGAHGEADFQACENEYEACMAGAADAFDRDWCEFDRDFCISECPGFEDEDGGGPGDGGGDDGDDGHSGEPKPDLPPDPDVPEVCLDLHAGCLEQAQSLQDVEACEALFDHCVDPGECDHECPSEGCPQQELDACLDGYAECVGDAPTQAQVDGCAVGFDDCTAKFDTSECLPPDDDGRLEQCLEEHALCVKCGDTPEHFEACKQVFDTCMDQAPIE